MDMLNLTDGKSTLFEDTQLKLFVFLRQIIHLIDGVMPLCN